MSDHRFLIIFAKEPRKGRVKTRLARCLTQDRVLDLYKAFVRDTVEMTRRCRRVHRVMAYDADGTPQFLKTVAPDFRFYRQHGRSLGERLHQAFVFAAEQGARKTVIIGSDAPDLPAHYIRTAFSELSRHDVVLGPTKDGGYYLVGLKRPLQKLFADIKWSSPVVLEQTLRRARDAKKKIFLMKPWADIDRVEDLRTLKTRLENHQTAACHTRRCIHGKSCAAAGHHHAV